MHILLTVLPEFSTKSAVVKYSFDSTQIEGTFAASALHQKFKYDHILAICTREAREPKPNLSESAVDVLKREVAGTSVSVAPVEAESDLTSFLDVSSKALDQLVQGNKQVRISVDFSNGLRQFAVMNYGLAAYYCELHELTFSGIYSLTMTRDGSPGQVHDLSQFVDLQKWLFAVQRFKKEDLSELLRLVQPLGDENLYRDLENIEKAFRFGLPLELGASARKYLKYKRKTLYKPFQSLPQGEVLLNEVVRQMKSFALGEEQPFLDKKAVVLDQFELLRQRDLIDKNFESGHAALAMAQMREWLISYIAHEQGVVDWLNKDSRKMIEMKLVRIRHFFDDKELKKMLTPGIKELADFWNKISDVRNAYAHCGMRPEDVSGNEFDDKVKKVKVRWNQFKEPATLKYLLDTEKVGLSYPCKNLAITVIGERIGLPYQFLKSAPVDFHCLFLVSQETRELAQQLACKLDLSEDRYHIEKLDDPYGGQNIKASTENLCKSLRTLLANSENIHVNLTGGTTFMIYCAEELAKLGQNTSSVSRYMVVDRRKREDQLLEPWAEGPEVVKL
ncbi:MAG: TM1812 family CRISPR-associated protein [Candidatus Cloacimonetes bacterium]|nr:TM1812 family CRISPR-associated protein [Candidatus Cloacimonadota bacterium]